jgi:adenylate cyclase
VSRQLSSTVVDAADAVALDNVVLDAEESAVRTVPLLAETDGDERTLVPTVGIVALARAEQLPLSVVEVDGGLRLGHMEIPTEAEQRLRVAYAPELSPGGSAVVSAGELLDADTDDPDLADKIVIVGITDPDSTRVVATPVGDAGRSPAVFVQANVLNTLLTGQFLRPVPDGVVVALIVALAFGVALATLVVPLWATPLAPIVAAGGFWLGAGSIVGSGRLLDVVFALAGIASAFVAGIIGRVGLELAHRRRVSNMFSRYVPPEIARQLMEEGEADAAAAGQRLTVTVVFCDLRGFTPYCASVSAAEVKVMLDTFYEFSTEVILDHGGTVMQFVGDEVFAVFGAPIARDDHATAALACSVEWQQQQAAFAGRLEELGLAPVTYGIGVHSGEVVAAHVGSTHRRQYTVMGEAVNIGARLCSEAAAGDIVISGQALDAAGDTVRATALGPLSLKGVTARVEGHRVEFGPSGEPVLSGT